MPTYTLRCEMLTEQSIESTFRVFEDPYNLAKITPPWLNFKVTSDRVQMRQGAEIDYIIRWLGLPMRWKTIIQAYDPPYLFVDEQAKGPYTLWQHHHTFRETAEGTLVGDRVDYVLPFGPLGQLAHMLMVRWQLLAIFRYRQKALAQMFEGRTKQTLAPTITRRLTSRWVSVEPALNFSAQR